MKKDKRLKNDGQPVSTEQQDAAAGAFINSENCEEISSMKRRIKKAHAKAKFAGILYLIGSIALFAFLFVPFLTVQTADNKAWEVSILTFLDPVFNLGGLNYNSLVLLPVCALYALMLLVGFINLLVSFSKLSGLSKKNPTRNKGYNRNFYAMQKLGNCFSGTLITVLFGLLLIYAVAKAEFSALVYLPIGVGVLVRLIAGPVSAKIGRYDIEETVVEYKRSSKVSAYFFRNLIHILVVVAIAFFFAKATNLNATLTGVSVSGFSYLTGNIKLLLDTVLQVLLLVWTFVLYNHAFHATEYSIDGMNAKGMKNYRVFSMFVAVNALAWFFVHYFAVSEWTWWILLIVPASLLAFVLDLVIKTKSNDRVRNACVEPKAQETAQQPVQPSYRIPLQCITRPGVFMQPNGQPVMVMPMQNGQPVMYQTPETAMPVPVPAPIPMPAPVPAPVQTEKKEETAQPETPAFNEWDGLTFEWEPNGKTREINCPYCAKKLKIKQGAPGYRCAACGRVFQLQKVKKEETPAQEESAEETQE